MSKMNTVVCDICGQTVYQHAKHQYQIRKRFWETDLLWTRMDLCEDCWCAVKECVQERIDALRG